MGRRNLKPFKSFHEAIREVELEIRILDAVTDHREIIDRYTHFFSLAMTQKRNECVENYE